MCMVFMICERSIASLRMRETMSPVPFCATTDTDNSERVNAQTSISAACRLNIHFSPEGRLGWLLAGRLYCFTGRKTQMSAAVKPTSEISRRVYVEGQLPGVKVPFREITQSPSRNFDGTMVANPPVRVYDTSGPWGDTDVQCDVTKGLPALREDWIRARGDVEEYEGREAKPIDDGYLTFEAANRARVKDVGKLEDFPALRRRVLRAKPGSCVTQLHYARRGIITPEMEFIAIRENLGREAAWEIAADASRDSLLHQHRGQSFGAAIPSY